MATITHGTPLPDSSQKTDFYTLIDSGTVTAVVNADIASNAAIVDTKLATIRTAGKVGGAALTELANIPSGAGVVPAANLTSVAQKGDNSDITSLSGLTTPLSQAQGGTGQTTAQAAIDALLPSQATANGQFLTSNGTNASWGGVTLYPTYYASSALIATDASAVSFVETDYTKKKSFALVGAGTITISFDLKVNTTGASRTAYGRIYRNGVAVGTEQSTTSGSYVTFTESISGWSNGDTVELWTKINISGSSNSFFYIYGSTMTATIY
jgi:hypothetical protein